MHKKLYIYFLLLMLGIISPGIYAQNLITNGDFSSNGTSWSVAFKLVPTTSGPINYTSNRMNVYVDNNGNSFPALNNNILTVNTTSFNLVNGINYNFSAQMRRRTDTGTTSYQGALQWVIIDASGNIVQTITPQYITRAASGGGSGNATGTLLATTATNYPSSITFSGTTGSYRLAMVWIAYQPSGTGSVDDVAIDNLSLQCIAPTITTQPNFPTQAYAQGDSAATLSITATDADSYQWYSNTTNSTIGGTPIVGAMGSSYTPPTTALGITYYYVVATNDCSTVTSNFGAIVVKGEDCNTDPNTVVYDQIMNGFRATMVKESNGSFKIWGSEAGSDGAAYIGANDVKYVLSPVTVQPNPEVPNRDYAYTGVPLHATLAGAGNGSTRFALLTTDGLYTWGSTADMFSVNATNVPAMYKFKKLSIGTKGIADGSNPSYQYGLPYMVSPGDVKMLHGNEYLVAIVTNSGNVWILSNYNSKNGDGGPNDPKWTKVRTDPFTELTGVVAVRGTSRAVMALTNTGEIYTWGTNTFLGGGAAKANRLFATKMTLPSGITPKMIGMVEDNNYTQTYYLLATNGELYGLGGNNNKQLGDFTTTTRTDWVQPQKSAIAGDYLNNISWIAPSDHYSGAGAINVITKDKKLWNWGYNFQRKLGPNADGALDPGYMRANGTGTDVLHIDDHVTYAATGGDASIILTEEHGNKYGYQGAGNYGAVGDGSFYNAGTHFFTPFQFITDIDICPVPFEEPVNYCVSGCNDNTYINAVDPNTIEYDNMVSVYHSTIVKEADGTVKIWGQGVAYNGTGSTGNVLTPQVVNSTNYPGLTGDILRFTGGSSGNEQQFAVLTTTGLFAWGDTDILIPADVKTSNVFGSISVGTYGVAGTKDDGLPDGVLPQDVKMMFGTERSFAIVTCTGQLWMLSRQGYMYGDGATDNTANDMVWHRVSTAAGVSLENVVAARGAYYGMTALTSDGEIYTWGRETHLGDGSVPADRLYATLMEKPVGATPKMIGMTFGYDGSTSTNELTYYLLATDGNLYSMGANRSRQLGDGTTTANNSWINVSATDNGELLGGNIIWISPQEHDASDLPAINVLTDTGKLWAWGDNNGGMLDGSSTATLDPTYMPGSITGAYDKEKLNLTDRLIAVETGGHTTVTIKECSTKFGYVGHRIHGSMADGTDANEFEDSYNFSDTSELALCGALTGPIVEDLQICPGQLANLEDAEPENLPPGITIEWWTTIDQTPGTQVMDITAVPAGTYYAFYTGGNPVGIGCPSVITVDTSGNCPSYCVEGCNPNTFINSVDPNTLEYDNFISLFHSSIIKEKDGTFKVWGDAVSPNGISPMTTPGEVSPANGYNYTGTPLRAAGGSTNASMQMTLLTTDGLYVWGVPGQLIPTAIKSTNAFGPVDIGTDGVAGTNPTGLPDGVLPEKVKMMFGSFQTLTIVTCDGDAWVLSFRGNKSGDGSTDDPANTVWRRVKTSATTNLNGVVALRGTPNALMALTSAGEVYTWGTAAYLGDNLARADRPYATKMTLPSAVSPKMIGMTQGVVSGNPIPTYYLLTTDGTLYSLGGNNYRQLGNGNTTQQQAWVQPQKPAAQGQGTGSLADVAWISPNEHDNGGMATINVLTSQGKLWAWGINDNFMIGGPMNNTPYDPLYMPGGLNTNDKIEAVETGGHTSMIWKDGETKFGYVGHKISGSMADGTSTNGVVSTYSFQTAAIQICGLTDEKCYKPGLLTGGDILDTKVGITALSRAGTDNADNWPMVRKGGWIALEAKTKGFVPNRVAFEDADSDVETPETPIGIPVADFVEGMMVYDATNKCVKVYTLKEGDSSMAWHCISTQTCPD